MGTFQTAEVFGCEKSEDAVAGEAACHSLKLHNYILSQMFAGLSQGMCNDRKQFTIRPSATI